MTSLAQWSDLPDHIIINILSYLDLSDRCSAALSCKVWLECFNDQTLWRRFTFYFKDERDTSQLECLVKHGRHLRAVKIFLNQKEQANRENACKVLFGLARCDERRLEEISITFTTENPLFFQGLEFLSALAELFGPPDPRVKLISSLTKVDLSGLSVNYRDLLLYLLADNHPNLQELNLQNTSLTCSISPECMHTVLRKCQKISSLSLHYWSTSEELFAELSGPNRPPLKYLSLACTREEKYHKVISAESWKSLVDRHKGLRVCIKFDHTIERHRILTILDPYIPIVELHLRTMTELHDEVSMVAMHYYRTLEHLVITTKGTDELKHALLDLVARSENLHTLQCYCALDEETIARIHDLRPQLKKYTLKTAEEFNLLVPTLTDLKECLESVWSNWFPSGRAMARHREPPH